jgi:hypothetical protein
MSLENSITELNGSVQALIALMNAQSAPVTKPKAVKAAKPAAVKQAEPTTPVATVKADDNFPTLEEVIDEMRNIKDRTVLSELMQGFGSTRASDIAEEKRSAFIEALQLELQKGAA